MALSVQKQRKSRWLKVETLDLIMGAAGVTAINLVVNNSLLSVGITLVAAATMALMLWSRELDRTAAWLNRVNRQTRLPLILLMVVSALVALNCLAQPASAQFFGDAEAWMTTQFEGAEEAIPLVFNVLRGLFLLYLGISLVKVVQAARQDEDWQNLARTPLIILIAITMGDLLTGLIIGGGGGQ